MLIERGQLTNWLRQSGEAVLEQENGATIRLDVHDPDVSIDLFWAKWNRPTLELFTALPSRFDESERAIFADRVLGINRQAWKTGAWMHMAGGKSVGVRSTVYLVDGKAASRSIDLAIDAIRDLVIAHGGEFRTHLDITQRRRTEPLNCGGITEEMRQALLSAATPHRIDLGYKGETLLLSTKVVPRLSARAAARAAGTSTGAALYRDAEGALVLATPTAIDADRQHAATTAKIARRCLVSDIDWLATAAPSLEP